LAAAVAARTRQGRLAAHSGVQEILDEQRLSSQGGVVVRYLVSWQGKAPGECTYVTSSALQGMPGGAAAIERWERRRPSPRFYAVPVSHRDRGLACARPRAGSPVVIAPG
jgi:hypothetical protein